LLLLLLFVPALVFVTGCDSDSNGGDDTGNGNNGNGQEAARLDTGPAEESETMVDVDYNDDGTAEVVRVTDVNNNGVVPPDMEGGKVTWTSDKTYELNGFVFVNPGDTLEIEAGTEIQGRLGGGAEASALIVASGGRIVAEGTADNPIVFTSVRAAEGDLGRSDRGLWGGVILLGDAPTNNGRQVAIEGVPDNTGARILYGGQNADHDVGTFKYVSIRHTGTQLGNGDEIQGLTLGGVGAGSTVEYVESYASDDDGFEWFGGTVNTKYLIAAFASDDAFDIDQGFRGSNQFWLAVQGSEAAGRASEMDGAGDAGATPIAQSIVANATYIGMGPDIDSGFEGDANDPFIIHRDDNATSYYNSIFTGGRTNAGIQIEDIDGTQDASDRWDGDQDGTPSPGDPLKHVNNTWYNIGPDYTGADNPSASDFEQLVQVTRNDEDNPDLATGDRGEDMISNLAAYMANNGHQLATSDPLQDITRDGGNGAIDSFNPSTASSVSGTVTSPVNDFGAESPGVNDDFVTVSERGAFPASANWNLNGWTKIVAQGELTGQ
jgi:hypothetical protein